MNFQYSQFSASTLKQHIEDGLPRGIISHNQEYYATMAFIDYNDVAKEVTVLIAGKDPQMPSTISRDVFIDGFVRVFVRPLLLHQFQDLKTVGYIKTKEGDFERAVGLLKGRVQYSNYWSVPHSFYNCMKLFGDNHPSIQGCLKVTFAKENSPIRSDTYTGATFTTPTFFNHYDLGWYVTNETHVLCQNGEVN